MSTLFEDSRQERSITFLLSSTDEGLLKQSGFTDHEIKTLKNLALEKLHHQKTAKIKSSFTIIRLVFCTQEIRAYPNLDKDSKLLGKTKVGDINGLQYETEKHDYETILKSVKNDKAHYRKKFKR